MALEITDDLLDVQKKYQSALRDHATLKTPNEIKLSEQNLTRLRTVAAKIAEKNRNDR